MVASDPAGNAESGGSRNLFSSIFGGDVQGNPVAEPGTGPGNGAVR